MQLIPRSLKAFAEGVHDRATRGPPIPAPPPDARDDLPKENPCQVAFGWLRQAGRPPILTDRAREVPFVTRSATTRLDLLAELRPVVEEFLEADVRERVLHELLEHRERQRDHVRARL